ncbi:MAG TPA: TIGR02996 domain-containing protein [Kofleriaceae bacterium]|jgi:uncharacterized protein (TIGR02996 family)
MDRADDVDHERRLIEQVLAAPDDDAPRMVYADWLTLRGDPRGEFIQLQCRLAAEPDDANRRAMRVAENKLLAAHEAAWLRPLLEQLPSQHLFERYKLEHVRGFVERAKLTLACVPDLDALFALAPALRELELTQGAVEPTHKRARPSVAGVFGRHFERLVALELDLPGGGNAIAREVAAAAALRNLERLAIRASTWGELAQFYDAQPTQLVLGDHGAAALAASPHLRGVRRLGLASNRLTLAGVRAIANGAWRLEALELDFNPLESEGLADALAGPALENLRELSLRGTWIPPTEAARLASSTTLANLIELDVENCALGAGGMAAFCDAFALPALRRLRVERNSLGDAGTLAIAGCPAFAQLRELEAGHNRIGQKGGTAIAESPYLANLERLTLNEPRWKPEMTTVFAGSPTLAKARIYLKGKLVARAKPKPKKPNTR